MIFFNFFFSILILCSYNFKHENKVIIIMGASCSGKSTLAKKLLEFLRKGWKMVELNTIEYAFKLKNIRLNNSELIAEIIKESNQKLNENYNIIIDTNIYDIKLNEIESYFKKFIFIYCPFDILLERNKARDINLNRPSLRAKRAKKYVKKSFNAFDNLTQFDIRIDSSTMSIEESLEYLKSNLNFSDPSIIL